MQGSKRMTKDTFRFWLFLAFVADCASFFIPVVGSVFISLVTLTFSIKRYGGNKAALWLGTAAVEAIPGLSIMPSCIWYVWRRYSANKMMTKSEADPKNTQPSEQIFDPTYS